METWITFLICAAALIAASALGAYMPFIRKLTDKQVHLLVSLSAGIFLGILFFLLVPEAFHECIESFPDVGEEDQIKYASIIIMLGFLTIMLVDIVIKHYHMVSCPCECHEDEHKHELTSFSAFIGLSVHAFCDGLVLAATLITNKDGVFGMALVGMCIHKFVVLFSLSSTFLLSEKPKKVIWIYLGSFILITPIAAIISFVLLNGMSVHGMTGIPLAFSAGTFMYVALCNMLPEAFHRKKQDLFAFAMLVVGILIAAAVFILIGHSH